MIFSYVVPGSVAEEASALVAQRELARSLSSSMASAPWSFPSPSSLYANSKKSADQSSPSTQSSPRRPWHSPSSPSSYCVPAGESSGEVLVATPTRTGSLSNPSSSKLIAAEKGDGRTKPKSVICTDCDGNGAVTCSQCKGSGVNSEDLFNGQFKAGDSCWLCGGRKHMLCGNCNGAGFVGGFMSTYDE